MSKVYFKVSFNTSFVRYSYTFDTRQEAYACYDNIEDPIKQKAVIKKCEYLTVNDLILPGVDSVM